MILACTREELLMSLNDLYADRIKGIFDADEYISTLSLVSNDSENDYVEYSFTLTDGTAGTFKFNRDDNLLVSLEVTQEGSLDYSTLQNVIEKVASELVELQAGGDVMMLINNFNSISKDNVDLVISRDSKYNSLIENDNKYDSIIALEPKMDNTAANLTSIEEHIVTSQEHVDEVEADRALINQYKTSAENARDSAISARENAESALSSCENALSSMGAKWLGTLSANPTLDGDGNAVVAGALYFNDVSETIFIYDGTTWHAPIEEARRWASEEEDVEVEPGKYSAYHYMKKAEALTDGYISDTDYATSSTGGVVKMRLTGSTLFITNDGSDA
jgi:hypothetical protein